MDPKLTTQVVGCWHVYVKCFMLVMLNSLPLNLVKLDIDRTMSSLNEVMSMAVSDDSAHVGGQIPLTIVLQSNEDTSVCLEDNPIATPSHPTAQAGTPATSGANSLTNLLPAVD